MDDRAHFGLGRAVRADSLEVNWPDGGAQTLRNVNADRLLVVKQADASHAAPGAASHAVTTSTGQWFTPITLRGLEYKQQTASSSDYNINRVAGA